VGLYKRKDSRFWWMAYTVKGGQRCESTKTPSKDLRRSGKLRSCSGSFRSAGRVSE
jgi:hypothetical protein